MHGPGHVMRSSPFPYLVSPILSSLEDDRVAPRRPWDSNLGVACLSFKFIYYLLFVIIILYYYFLFLLFFLFYYCYFTILLLFQPFNFIVCFLICKDTSSVVSPLSLDTLFQGRPCQGWSDPAVCLWFSEITLIN